jgi:hypothetical protein
MQIKFTAQLLACPAKTDDDDDNDDRAFTALDEWEGGIVNAVVLRSGRDISIASTSFMPTVCKREQPGQQPVTTTVSGADVFVRKFANVHPNWNRPERGWEATWLVVYGNRGSESATDVVLTDTPGGNPSPELVRSAPALTPSLQGGSLVFDIGALNSLQGGAVLFRTPLTFTAPAGTVLSNMASISATNDVSTTNNTSAVSLTVPSLPPVITYPTNGATCTGTLTITGLAQAGSVVNISVDRANVISATADANGVWSASVFLEDGVHVLRASTSAGNSVRRSHPVTLKVNSALLWDPISMTFTAPDGSLQRPRHYMGWFNQAGWYVTLAPSTTYTSSVRICCTDPATVTMTIPGTGDVPFTDADGDKIFTASFTTGDAKSMLNGIAKLCVSSAGESDCGMGRIVPLISPQRRQVVVLTKDGFYPPNVRLNRDEAVEIVNMDSTSRAISSSPGMGMMTSDAETASGDGIYLGTGESYVFEAAGATTLYDATNSNQKLTINVAGSGVYIPLIIR